VSVNKTGIEWTDLTWNPVTGCSPISAGCQNCYAATMAHRLQKMGQAKYKDGFKVTLHHGTLDEPLMKRKPSRIFVCSMADLFHEDVPFIFIEHVFEVIRQCELRHEFQLLTKRPQRVLDFWKWRQEAYLGPSQNCVWPANAWMGVTAENQAMADERIPLLLQTPAAVRFVSVEPMLGPVNVNLSPIQGVAEFMREGEDPWLRCQRTRQQWLDRQKQLSKQPLDWVICGPETGPKARTFKMEWAENLALQCSTVGVPFFWKGKGDDLAKQFPATRSVK
jgi:protein gp37